jgi:hypothetical protein
MQQRTPSRNNLLNHQAMLERSLRDLTAGKKTDHLAEDELGLLIAGLEARLVGVREALKAFGYDLR